MPLSDDLLLADHLSRIYILQAGETNRQRIDHSIITPVSVREAAASDGKYTQEDTKVRIPKSKCKLFTPEVGGYLEIDQEAALWSIVGFENLRRLAEYRLWCKRAVDVDTLSGAATIDVMSFTVKKDADLAPYRHWLVQASPKAIIQPIKTVFQTDIVRRRPETTHICFLEKPKTYTLIPSMRLRVSPQEEYDILSVTEPELGTLMALDIVTATSAARD